MKIELTPEAAKAVYDKTRAQIEIVESALGLFRHAEMSSLSAPIGP